MPGVKLDDTRAGSDAPALHLGRGCQVICAYDVRGGLLLPGDLARRLLERRERLPREAA